MNRARMLCLATSLLLVACGGGDGPTSPPAVTSVTITTSSGTLAAIGETTTLTALAKSAKGATIGGATITWSSSSPNVATVSGGVVTAVGNGTTTISATADGIAGTTQITVQQSVTQVSVTFASDTIRALGDTARASTTPRDARGNAVAGKTATWSSLTPAVVTIDGTGLMTAIAEGTGTVVVTVDAQQGQRVVQVRQRAAKLVIMTQPDGARAGIALTTQPVVEVQDARGNRVTAP